MAEVESVFVEVPTGGREGVTQVTQESCPRGSGVEQVKCRWGGDENESVRDEMASTYVPVERVLSRHREVSQVEQGDGMDVVCLDYRQTAVGTEGDFVGRVGNICCGLVESSRGDKTTSSIDGVDGEVGLRVPNNDSGKIGGNRHSRPGGGKTSRNSFTPKPESIAHLDIVRKVVVVEDVTCPPSAPLEGDVAMHEQFDILV